MQSIYTHGTVLQAENPEQLAAFIKVGWGAEIIFKKPRRGLDPRIPEAIEDQGPGSWFHLPLTSTPRPGPGEFTYSYLISVVLVIETIHCRITDLHVYDGPWLLEETHFPFTLGHPPPGGLWAKRDQPYTHSLRHHYRMSFAAGLSFYACSFINDFPRSNPDESPPGRLIVSAGGANYRVESLSVYGEKDVITVSWRK